MSAAISTAPQCSHLDDQINASIEDIEADAADALIEQLDDNNSAAFKHAAVWLYDVYRLRPSQVRTCDREPMLEKWIDYLHDTDYKLWRDQVERSTAAIVDGCHQ